MHPHIRRVHVDENGHVAHDSNRIGCRSLAKIVPLHGKRELQHPFQGQFAAVLRYCLGQRLRLAAAQRFGPRRPRAGIELAAQHGIKGVIVEPAHFIPAKLLKLFPRFGQLGVEWPAVEEVPRRLVKQGQLALLHLIEIHIAAASGQPGDALPLDPAQSQRNSRLMRFGLPAKAEEPA